MKAAIIGCGAVAQTHAEAVLQAGHKLVAFCDASLYRAEAYRDRYAHSAFVTDDYRKVIALAPDVIHLCTPHHLHCAMAEAALKAGIHVLTEKPLGIDRQNMRRLLDAERKAEKNGTILGVCLQNRFLPANVRAKALLSSAEIVSAEGRVHWRRDKAYYDSGDWRGKWSTEGGGALINQALHTLDLLQWFVGYPQQVRATVENRAHPYIEVEDTADCLFDCSGIPMRLFATTAAASNEPVQITVHTSEGTIGVTGDELRINGTLQDRVQLPGKPVKEYWGMGHTLLIGAFYDCASARKPFAINGREGAKSAFMTLAAYASGGGRISIEQPEERAGEQKTDISGVNRPDERFTKNRQTDTFVKKGAG